MPNECWQPDFTHWPLGGGTGAEIINWLGDLSRYLLACSAHTPVTGTIVVNTFLQAGNTYGLPAPTLTDIQRARLHRPLRRRPERLRVPPCRPGRHPEERQAEPPPDPGQGGEISPDPETLAGLAAARCHPGRAATPARRLPRALQRAPPQPGTAARHPRPGLPGTAQGPTRRHSARPLPAPLRPRRCRRQRSASAGPAACTTWASARPTASGCRRAAVRKGIRGRDAGDAGHRNTRLQDPILDYSRRDALPGMAGWTCRGVCSGLCAL